MADLEPLPGWVWDPLAVRYESTIAALEQFVDREGHAQPKVIQIEVFEGEEFKIGSWVRSRRSEYQKGTLSSELVTRLEALPGWVWDPDEADFQHWLEVLDQFIEREGHARVSSRHVESVEGKEVKLGMWVSNCRSRRTTALSPELIVELESRPGWFWDPREADFLDSLAALQQFVDREGHARPPGQHLERFQGKEFRLALKIEKFRAKYRRGAMTDEHARALESLPGWVWSTR